MNTKINIIRTLGSLPPLVRTGLFILSAVLASMFVMACVFPELMVLRSRSFMYQHDTGIPYENVFTLVSHYFHGGIQLWDRYDQMSYAYSHLSSGLYTLANMFTAGCYIVFSFFSRSSAQAFHSVYAVCFFGATISIRTLGGYVLLRKLLRDPGIIFISLIYLNTFLSTTQYSLLTANLYSYLPFLLYFIISFFQFFRLTDFLGFVCILTIAIANSPLFALGYFYQCVHFFIICSLIWFCLIERKKTWPRFAQSLKKGMKGWNVIRIVMVGLVCLIMLLPIIEMKEMLDKDFFIPGSGIGDTEGRLKNVFSVSKYFQVINSSYSKGNVWVRFLDYERNQWMFGWPFVGATALLLASLGLISARDKRKYIFLGTIILILLLNVKRDMFSVLSLSHWLNALTNPFSFLLRSFHMPALLLPFFFLPLIAWGLQALRNIVLRTGLERAEKRIFAGMAVCCVFVIISAMILPHAVKVYVLTVTGAFFILLYAGWKKDNLTEPWSGLVRKYFKYFAVILLALAGIYDLWAFSVNIRNDPYSRWDLKPRLYRGLDARQAHILDYQNPKIFPLREYYRTNERFIEPRLYTRQNHYGLLYQFFALDRPMTLADIYTPVHVSYQDLHHDPVAKEYLNRDKRVIYLAKAAIPASRATLGELLQKQLDHDIILVEEDSPGLPQMVEDYSLTSRLSQQRPSSKITERFTFFFSEASQRKLSEDRVEYSFPLPENFPEYFSTTLFSEDQDHWRLTIGQQSLSPVQGKLLLPFTYDVQNVREGYLVLLLPQDFSLADKSVILEVSRIPGVTDVWRNEHDNLGLTYHAVHDGWLVFHFPYDSKWQLTVDQKPGKLFKVNKYFIGTPVSLGEHTIFLQYWPQSKLRFMIKSSLVCVVLTFVFLVVYAVRKEPVMFS